MPNDSKFPARSTLEAAPERLSRFLRGVAQNAHIRAALAGEGYDDGDHEQGWRHFHAVSGYRPDIPLVVDDGAGRAMAELDALDAPFIDKIDARLQYSHPAQRDKILAGISAGERAVAVSNVAIILERLDALEASSDPSDVEAVQRLAKVKVDAAERTRLAERVKAAQGFEATSGVVESDEARWQRLEPLYRGLYFWLAEWSRAAKRAITRRDWLLSLGLAKRRRPGSAAESDTSDASDTDEE